ncbi:cytochrome P450 71D445 isoform X1 [Ricinus communis]|uniref:cytochrome P450 71D445 isoform X1 n=1 Tax=Ricinus communis TaxID=3988 RepID=UPI00201B0D04|nr:cytochrome P450 71D445 isoform X1 [Ricinus communis]
MSLSPEFQSPFMDFHFPIVFITLLLMFAVLKIWIKQSKTSKSAALNLPPGPFQLPIIGNIHQLAGHVPHHRMRDLAEKYGPVMLLQVGDLTTIVISSAETAKQVLKTHDLFFAQRPNILAAQIITYNNQDIGFAPNGPYWRQLRKLCSLQLLHVKRVQSFRPIREEEVSNIISVISSTGGSPINLSELIRTFTYRLISRTAFGKIWDGEEEYLTAMKKILMELGKCATLADVFPSIKLLRMINRGSRIKVEKHFEKVDKKFQNILNEHRARKGFANSAGAESEKVEDEDLVDVLLDLQKKGELEFPLMDENIKAVIMDMFFGGTDTSSATIEWTMSELIKNQRVMEKAQAEVRQIFGAKGDVDEAGLHQLIYLKLVINETLRLHPPAPMLLPRECIANCVINGYDIPTMSKVIINAWAIGRDPRYWVEPEKYNPERFLCDSIDHKKTNFEFLPFGGGRRMCPGISFGMATVELPLARMLYHFDWKLPEGQNPENLDMTEYLGVAGRRKNDLYLIPSPCIPPTFK